jgi:hypothetical protein
MAKVFCRGCAIWGNLENNNKFNILKYEMQKIHS